MNKLLCFIALSVLAVSVLSQDATDIVDPTQVIATTNNVDETQYANTLIDQVKALNNDSGDSGDAAALPEPEQTPDASGDVTTGGFIPDDGDDYKTVDYLDFSDNTESFEPDEVTEDSIQGFTVDDLDNFKMTDYLDDYANTEAGGEPLQSPIAILPDVNDEVQGYVVDNLDEHRIVDYTEPELADGDDEGTQGSVVDNPNDFKNVDYVEPEQAEEVDNSEGKVGDDSTPGIVVPAYSNDREQSSGDDKESETSETDNQSIDTVDVKEQGFLPNN